MSYQHYRSPFGDTTFTKVFVGGLAWETPTDVMRHYFDQFGEILEAVIINDKNTGKSKGYGFVTFRDPESAKRACIEANPVIDGRRANCNIASLGRPRPSPPRGRGGGAPAAQGSPYGGGMPPTPPPPPAVFYPPYGYAAYPQEYGYHQGYYNPAQAQLQQQPQQYYHHQHQQQQFYGSPSSSGMGMGPTYYYGYSMQMQQPPNPRQPVQRIPSPSYLYYPPQMDSSFSSPTATATAATTTTATYLTLPHPPDHVIPITTTLHQTSPPTVTRKLFPSPSDSQSHQSAQPSNSTSETDNGGMMITTSESPST
ncbi:probable RNA-binding protein ARP1 [Impatiens glandulifera]|uniref:probable RNA-binding protein ARP1 n=1 Tax=Impatiens glandulifera TaxID=253017 RepID=UPI001FB140EB|nr:probable RNA-binding protein ARP1 [Impatiens glandulifera]